MSSETKGAREAIDRVAVRIRNETARGGQQITHEQARKQAIEIAKRNDRRQNR